MNFIRSASAASAYKCIEHIKKSELQDALLELVMDGPDWQYDRFVRKYIGYDF